MKVLGNVVQFHVKKNQTDLVVNAYCIAREIHYLGWDLSRLYEKTFSMIESLKMPNLFTNMKERFWDVVGTGKVNCTGKKKFD